MQMWSCAIYDLNCSDDEFFRLTPRRFEALLKRHRHNVESNELLFGQLTSWVASTGFKSSDKPTSAKDFMPSQWAKSAAKSQVKPKRITRSRRRAIADGIRTMFPAR
jgi:hypothetical protein